MLRPSLVAFPARGGSGFGHVPGGLRAWSRRLPRWRPSWAGVRRVAPVGLAFGVYLAIGLWFSIGAGLITGDAWSRLGNAYYILFSRDPHLAAVGFVWNPLPSLVELPLLPFKAIWPAIVDRGVGASLMSALFMALTVRELWIWLRELRVSRPATLGLVVAFAVHPMIVLYGGNGMSEAPFLFFLVVAGRHFSTWLTSRDVRPLALTGLALGLAYLTRYEAVAPIGAVIVATGLVSARQSAGTRRERTRAGVADALIVGAPPVGVFVLWAFASWLIVGNPFETISSVYGNSSQVALSHDQIQAATGATPAAAFAYLMRQMDGLEPALFAVLALGTGVAVARADLRIVAPLAVFGSVLAFSGVLFLAGGSFGWLRFSITSIPLVVVILGVVVAGVPRPHHWRLLGLLRSSAVAGLAGLALIALPAGTQTLFQPALAREEATHIEVLIAPGSDTHGDHRAFVVGGEVARYLDAQDLPRGSVVVDVAFGFWVVLQSKHPAQFVITPDRDFDRIVADPGAFGARFLLVSPISGLGGFGALERAHPGLYRTGAGISTLVRDFADTTDGNVDWRLYAVSAR